jgi:sugar lactone lactonase YvrE
MPYECPAAVAGHSCIATHLALDEAGRVLLSVVEPFLTRSAWVQRVDPEAHTIDNIGQFTCPQLPLSGGCAAIGEVVGDGRGGAYVTRSDYIEGSRVVRLDLTTGTDTLVAGTDYSCADGGAATNACVTATVVARDDDGLYLGEPGRIRKFDVVSGTISTILSPAEPAALLPDGAGGLLVADGGRGIRRIDLESGEVSTICGDDLPAERWCLFVTGLAFDLRGDLLIASRDYDSVIRIDRNTNQAVEGLAYTAVTHLSTAPNGDLFISDPDFDAGDVQSYGRITRRDARNGAFAVVAEGLQQTNILVDATGTGLLFADALRIGRVDLGSGQITTIAGAAENCDAADGAPNLQGCLAPRGLALDRDGAILTTTPIPDRFDRRVVRITPEHPVPPWWCFAGNYSTACHLLALEQGTPCPPGAMTKRLDAVLQRGVARIRALLARSPGSAVSRKVRRVISRMALAARESRGTTKACRSSLRATARALRRSLADV